MRRERAPTHPQRLTSTSDPLGSSKGLTPSFAGSADTPDQAASTQGYPSQCCLSKTAG